MAAARAQNIDKKQQGVNVSPLKSFETTLSEDVINLDKLKELCFNGIPDDSDHRAVCWRILLNYLPLRRCQWDQTLAQKRQNYKQFIDDMIVMPGSKCDDHPLNIEPDSKWQTYFKDNDVLLQIDKDVRRLCPDISFFQQATDYPCSAIVDAEDKRLHFRVQNTALKSANVERKGLGMTKITLFNRKPVDEYLPMAQGKEAHWEVVERILFLYAKLNPGQGYVQGMNEIIGPIYYTFATHHNLDFRKHAEADSFFCFTHLMAETRDYFIKSLDSAECGINSMMSQLMQLVKRCDPNVAQQLTLQKLYPQFYAFRWITLLLSQEFLLPDVIRVWDSLFSDQSRFEFLIYICAAMIVLMHDSILENDFSNNVKLLQNFPAMDINVVISKATELMNNDKQSLNN